MNPRILFSLIGLIAGIYSGSGIAFGTSENPANDLITLFAAIPLLIWVFGVMKKAGWVSVYQLFFLTCYFVAGYISISTSRLEVKFTDSTQILMIGKVQSVRQVSDKMVQVIIRPRTMRSDSISTSCRGKMVLLMRPGKEPVHPGEIHEFGPLRISKVSGKESQAGFIPERYWRSKGIEYEAWVYPGQYRLILAAEGLGIKGKLLEWQASLVQKISRMPLSDETRGLLAAMIFGDRGGMEKSVIQSFSRAGIVHVISVSGLHVGIIYLIISWMVSKVPFVSIKAGYLLSIIFVWGYTGITGFSDSACRAAGMISLFAIARLTSRTNSGLDVLASIALLQCLINPFLIFSAGAQLSYLAVAGIFLWMPTLKANIKGKFIKKRILESAAISVSAQSLLVPVLLFWFGWIPVYFLIGNLILLPLLILAFYVGLALVALDSVGLSFHPACAVVDFLVFVTQMGAEWLGSLPGNLFEPGKISFTDTLLYYGLLLMIRMYMLKPSPTLFKNFLWPVGWTVLFLLIKYILL